jgi:hypothetical protein
MLALIYQHQPDPSWVIKSGEKAMEKSLNEKWEICCRFMGDFNEKYLTHGDLDGISVFWGGILD